MLSKFSCCTTDTNLRTSFIRKLRNELFDREDFTQGEFIEAIDSVREWFQQDTSINHEELDEIVKSLTNEWKDIGEIIRMDNQSKRTTHFLALIIGGTAVVTGLLTWLVLRKKD